MKHRKLADDVSMVSSIHSNVTRALRVRMPTKPKRSLSTAPPKQPTEIRSDFAVPMEMPSTSIVIAESPSRPKRKAATKASAALIKNVQHPRLPNQMNPSHQYKLPPTTSRPGVIARNKRREIIKQQQIQNKSIISAIKTAAAQTHQSETDFTVGPCSPTQSYPTQFYVSPSYEGPESSMTVGEAERYYESDSV